jgi:hypothetical protein
VCVPRTPSLSLSLTSAFLASQPQRLTVDDEACMGELTSLGHP